MTPPPTNTPATGLRYFPAVFGLVHAAVDAATVMTVNATRWAHGLTAQETYFWLMAYDLLAFVGQTPLGALLDRLRLFRGAAILGVILCGLGIAALPLSPWLAVALAGLGNALFHVGAGALSLHVEPGKATPVGVFVAPGALGLAVGGMVGKSEGVILWPFLLALAVGLVAAWLCPAPRRIPRPAEAHRPEVRWPAALVLLLLLSILIRSLVGFGAPSALPRLPVVAWSLAAAAFAGKGIGGVLSDRLGFVRVSVGALLISAPLIAFGGSSWPVMIGGLLLFQMTMPVTLVATATLLPGRPGLAFGLNCLAYILGFFPNTQPAVRALYGPLTLLGLILLSALCVYLGLRPLRGQYSPRPRASTPAP